MKDRKNKNVTDGWLLFFYSVPSRPVSNRMKIWRKLSKVGAVQIKGAVYILPMNEEHYEFFEWLVSEVSSMGGEAAFTRVTAIDSIDDRELVGLFKMHKEMEYLSIGKSIEDMEMKINSVKKGSKSQNLKAISDQTARLSKSYEEILKTDFFSSDAGAMLRPRLDALNTAIRSLLGAAAESKPAVVPSRRLDDYQGKIWISRKRPFVDRMASAWLIRRFIDSHAKFRLLDDKSLASPGRGEVTFDVSGGMFTHVGDSCTFEVLLRSFGLKNKALRRIGEVVHNLDIKDDKYEASEAAGLEDILLGLKKSVKDDMELLEKGMTVFEMLYLSKAG